MKTEYSQLMTTKTALEYFRDEGLTVGINLGSTLDAVDHYTNPENPIAVETAWGNPKAKQELFNSYRDLGFKIIRIPISWSGHIGSAPDYIICETWLKRVEEVVNMANNAGLKVIINIHNDGHHGLGGWLIINKASVRGNTIACQFEKVWRQIAEYFKNYGDWLMFQGFNEIHSGDWGHGTRAQYKIINDWNQRFTNVVRSTGDNNANRFLLYYGYNTSYKIGKRFTRFVLPKDTAANRQVVGFHFYFPMNFSLMVLNHIWPNSGHLGKQKDIDKVFQNFKKKFIDNGIPVIIGENGPFRYAHYTGEHGNPGYNPANIQVAHQNRLAYVNYFYTKARENRIVPFYWESGHIYETNYAISPDNLTHGDGGLMDRNTCQPNSPESAGIIRAMINAVNNKAS